MRKDKIMLIGLVEGYLDIAYVLSQVAKGKMSTTKAIDSNPYLKEEITVALENAGYIKEREEEIDLPDRIVTEGIDLDKIKKGDING